MSDYIGNSPNFATTPVQKGTGNGTANPITLNFTPGSDDAILVSFNGIVQTPVDHYTVLGNQLTPTSIIPTGYPILITYKAIAAQIGVTQASAVQFTPTGTITKPNTQEALVEVAAAGGAKGAGRDQVFFENDATITSSYTIGIGAYVAGVTISIASPATFALTSHGFVSGSQVMFATTGALPTGLTIDTVYYVISTGLTANGFQVSNVTGGTAIATSGTQSGIHSVGKVRNAMSAGPVTIADTAVVTIPTGVIWTIV